MRVAQRQKIKQFAEWLALREDERVIKTQKDFAKSIGVVEQTLIRWKEQLQDTTEDETEQIEAFKKKVYRDAIRPNATGKDKELFGRLKGLFIDRPETKEQIELTADGITRRNLEAERRLREGGYRVASMPTERPLLS